MMELKATHLYKSYNGQAVLQDWCFSIGASQRIALMGPSGCGKTTFLRILMGLEQPESGTVDGLESLRISAVFQQPRLCPSLSGLDNLLLVTEKSPTRIQQAKGLLERMGLGKDHWSKPVLKLSGGQQQRIAIARALMIPFDILLLDEAFQGLDATSRELACQLVLEHCKGKMLLAVTHHPQEAELLQAEIFTME